MLLFVHQDPLDELACEVEGGAASARLAWRWACYAAAAAAGEQALAADTTQLPLGGTCTGQWEYSISRKIAFVPFLGCWGQPRAAAPTTASTTSPVQAAKRTCVKIAMCHKQQGRGLLPATVATLVTAACDIASYIRTWS